MNKITETEPVVEMTFTLFGTGKLSKITLRKNRDGKSAKSLVEDLVAKAIADKGVWINNTFCQWRYVIRIDWRLDQPNQDEIQEREARTSSALLGR